MTEGGNNIYKIGEKTAYIKYGTLVGWDSDKGNKKVFQAYLFNKAYKDATGTYRDLTGRLYLLVISSETDLNSSDVLLSPFSTKDTVDLFELTGRPVVKTE